MAQFNFTLDYDFLVGLFSESREKAFAKLMEALLNQILKIESAAQLGAEHYERSEEREDYRNGTRQRYLTTRIGKLELEVPRHRNKPFQTLLFENYQRQEQALITTMMEMVVQGVSTRKVEKVTQELCGESFSKSMVSDICKKLDVQVKSFQHRPLMGEYPFVIVDAIYVKVREHHRIVSKALLIAVGINETGRKEVVGFTLSETESESTWGQFFEELKERGLHGVEVMISDSHKGLVKAMRESYPGTSWQRCQVHFLRNLIEKTPKKYQEGLKTELREMFQASTLEEARRLCGEILEEYEEVAPETTRLLEEGFDDAMTVLALPLKYRISLRTSNILERTNRELRRRERVVQIFPNGEAAIRLMGAVLQDLNEKWSKGHRLFGMEEYFNKIGVIKKTIEKQKSA